jgi:uncharacterized protein
MLLLMITLGFLGSFGHCFGMCGPLAVAFSLSTQEQTSNWRSQFKYHFLLNLGRMVSYTVVGAALGALGAILLQSGQLAGVGSDLRRWMAIITGILLIWFGLGQITPNLLPRFPLLHPLISGALHNNLSGEMVKLSLQNRWWTPALLGTTWGLMPCGFLYVAQIKAAETGNIWLGAATMSAFGLGTLPTMLGVGVSSSMLSKDRRSQLFRLGGWVTLAIGVITLLRTGDTMVDYTGHGALICLTLALLARPISRFWSIPLKYRRALGVGAFVLASAHTFHMMEHTLQWNFNAFWFQLPFHQIGMAMGGMALVLMIPAALTSFDKAQKYLGPRWRKIHLLGVPALIFTVIHTILIGSHYLGTMPPGLANQLATVFLVVICLFVLLLRLRLFWQILSIEKYYGSVNKY